MRHDEHFEEELQVICNFLSCAYLHSRSGFVYLIERQSGHGTLATQGVTLFVTQISEESNGNFHIFGKTWIRNQPGKSILLHVNDFRPYFFCAAPMLKQVSWCRAWNARGFTPCLPALPVRKTST